MLVKVCVAANPTTESPVTAAFKFVKEGVASHVPTFAPRPARFATV